MMMTVPPLTTVRPRCTSSALQRTRSTSIPRLARSAPCETWFLFHDVLPDPLHREMEYRRMPGQGRPIWCVCVCFTLATFACSPACHVLSRRVSGIQGLWTSYSDYICEVWPKGWKGWCRPSMDWNDLKVMYGTSFNFSLIFLWIWYEFHCFLSFGSELGWQLWKCSKRFLHE